MAGLSPDDASGITFTVAADPDATAVVTVSGELDIANIDALERAAAPIIQTRPRLLIVDIGGLRFADSSAIALWVRWAAIVGQLELRDPSPLLRQVISSMGLEHTLRLTG